MPTTLASNLRGVIDRLRGRLRLRTGGSAAVVSLSAVTAAGQAIGFAASLILARIYSPEDFGAFALLTSTISVLAIVATGRLELAIPLPSESGEARSVAAASLLLSAGASVVCGAVLALVPQAQRYLNPQEIPYFPALTALALFATSGTAVLSYWAIRTGAFGRLSWARFTMPTATSVAQIAASPLAALGLPLGYAIGSATSIGVLARPRRWLRARPSPVDMWHSVVRYRRFPLLSTWAGLIGALGSNFAPFLLVTTAGTAAAGMFALAWRVAGAPVTLIGGSVAAVFYQRCAQANRDGTIGHLVLDVHKRLSASAAPAFIIGGAAAPDAFSLLFGPEWRVAGVYAAILSPMLYLNLLNFPLGSVFLVREKQSLSLVFQAGMTLLRVGGMTAGSAIAGSTGAVAGFSIGASLGYVAFILVNNGVAGNRAKPLLKDAAHALVTAVVAGGPIALALIAPIPTTMAVVLFLVGLFTLVRHYGPLLRTARADN